MYHLYTRYVYVESTSPTIHEFPTVQIWRTRCTRLRSITGGGVVPGGGVTSSVTSFCEEFVTQESYSG
jgi:hypothetical protein